MPRRNRHKKIKGGDFNNWWSDNVTNSDWLNRTKSYIPSWMSGDSSQSSTGFSNMGFGSTSSSDSSDFNFGTTGSNTGGRKTKRKHGGYTGNTPTTGLAEKASPVSGLQTAKPHTLVGGKTKRHRKHSKTCKHRKH